MKTRYYKVNRENASQVLGEGADCIGRGGLVAFPTETVYGLGGDAMNPQAAGKIYAAKGRPSDNPLIAHIGSLNQLEILAREIPPSLEPLAKTFWPGPLTVILKKRKEVPLATSGGLDTIAIRMPSHPLAHSFLQLCHTPVAAPSANLSGRPSPTRGEHVREDMEGRIDMILDGGPVGIGLESTIVDLSVHPPLILRPGAITLSMLRKVLPDLIMDPGLAKPMEENQHPKAPGMKYRHYAPRGVLCIVQGEREKLREALRERAAGVLQEGKRGGLLITLENLPYFEAFRLALPPGEQSRLCLLCLGSRDNPEEIARNLFACLRRFDEENTDCIFSEGFLEEGLEGAIMNRLKKAAGGRIQTV